MLDYLYYVQVVSHLGFFLVLHMNALIIGNITNTDTTIRITVTVVMIEELLSGIGPINF